MSLLRDRKDFVSGQQLCEQFGVSRTAVWKAVNQLKEEGYQIEAVSRRGYRLLESPDILSEDEIVSRLKTDWMGQAVHYADETTSTNTDAKRYAEEGAPHGTIAVADMQTTGRGRRGKTWASPSGRAIYMTILLRPDFLPDQASMLTLVMALSVADAVTEMTGLETGIKWPNDIVVNGKKICGILTEMNMNVELNAIEYVIIGVGINVNNDSPAEFPEEIRQMATSLKIESGIQISRAALIAETALQFERNYDMFVRNMNLEPLLDAYDKHLLNIGKEVKILDPKGEYTGIARGINKTGELLVETQDGRTVEVYAGEVSVRGLYGYV